MTQGLSSDDLDGDALGVGCECFEVGLIPGEHGPARFGQGYNECVDGRSGPSESSELGGTSRRRFAHRDLDDAGLEEPVRVRIASSVAVE